MLNGLGFLLFKVLNSDKISYFLERGHRDLGKLFKLVAALINRLLPIIILFGGSGRDSRKTRYRLDDLGQVDSLVS
jgi:hypothetical protein